MGRAGTALVLFSLLVLMIGLGRAAVYRAETGYELQLCNWASCQTDSVAMGVSAQITVPQEPIQAGRTVAYWVSLDGWTAFGVQEWIQAGYVLGVQQDGSFSSVPVMYVESCASGCTGPGTTGYYLGIVGAATFGVAHNFNVYTTKNCGLTCIITGYLMIDGIVYHNVQLDSATWTPGVTASAQMEAFQDDIDVNAHWTGLQYMNPFGSWHNWGDPPGFLETTSSITVSNTCDYGTVSISQTEFTVAWSTCGGRISRANAD